MLKRVKFMLLMKIFFLLLSLLSSTGVAANYILLNNGLTTTILKSSEILSSKKIEYLENIELQAYPKRKFNLYAIKLCNLFRHSNSKNFEVKVIAKDKFFAYLSNKDLAWCQPSINTPYIVIQEKLTEWPKIKGNHEGLGIFSLIWIGKDAKKVSKEKWVRNIGLIEISETSQKIFLNLLPKNPSKEIKSGLKVFEDNCSGCHSINLKGQKEIGPDLNYPMSPLEYYPTEIFRKFVRDPQSVRYFKNSRMEGFNSESISDKNLEDLIRFLSFIKKNKGQHEIK